MFHIKTRLISMIRKTFSRDTLNETISVDVISVSVYMSILLNHSNSSTSQLFFVGNNEDHLYFRNITLSTVNGNRITIIFLQKGTKHVQIYCV